MIWTCSFNINMILFRPGGSNDQSEVPTHQPFLQSSLSLGFLQKLAQNPPKLKPSMQVRDSDLKVQDDTENKRCARTGASSLSQPYSEMHANIVSLQITNLAAGFILRPFWRGSNTVTAIPPNPLPIVTTQTDLNSQVDQNCIYNRKWDYNEIFPESIYIIYQLEVKSAARIQPQTNSLSLFHRATLSSLPWVYKLQTTEI